MKDGKKQTYLDIVNNSSSRVVLECTRSYTTQNSTYPSVTYLKGELLPRNLIFVNPAYWRIASRTKSEKYWKGKDKKLNALIELRNAKLSLS
jgi:hypothetical protein